MNDGSLAQNLEALLLSTGDSLRTADLQRALREARERALAERAEKGEEGSPVEEDLPPEPPAREELESALAALGDRWQREGRPYELGRGPEGYQLVLRAGFAPVIRALRREPPPARLSRAALETLAIVAYRQPVTRAEMERIRGVSVDSALGKLQEHGLVDAAGRAELPGRPVLYASTDRFLELCGIGSLEELPASDVLTPLQLDEWVREEKGPEEVPDTGMMGLAPGAEEAVAGNGAEEAVASTGEGGR